MAVLSTAADFLALLDKSRLLPPMQLADAVREHGLAGLPTPQEAANVAVAKGLITRYQANRLLEGSRRGLFLDEYKLVEILGSGGMGYLYAALEPKTGWKVALKVLSDRFRLDRGMLSRFRLEAEAGLKLTHPNIVRTKALRTSEDIYGVIHYMVMELIKGVSLHELLAIRQRTLSWRQACDVICQAATGLHYAHEQGLVHRDVKPENLLIRADGAVKLLDFGLAMIEHSEAEFSLAAILGQNCLGTADYIAPEQSLDSLHVDRRADIYALGCTFYFLVTGRVPFPVEAITAKLDGHRREKAQPVHEINVVVPERVSRIIQKMMAKQPKNRFQTAAELCQYLQPLGERKPIDFDFESVLAKRAQTAEERLAKDSFIRGDSRLSSATKLEIGKVRQAKHDVETPILSNGRNGQGTPPAARNGAP